jgi:hypothetical protein
VADPILNNFKTPPDFSPGVFYCRLSLLLFVLMLPLMSFAQAKLKVTEPKFHFGEIERGEIVKHNYEIINTGDQPLIITEAEVSCSCTSAEFPQQPVLPGQKAHVTLIFNTATVYGRQDRVLKIHSNDPSGPAKLRYKGTVSSK